MKKLNDDSIEITCKSSICKRREIGQNSSRIINEYGD